MQIKAATASKSESSRGGNAGRSFAVHAECRQAEWYKAFHGNAEGRTSGQSIKGRDVPKVSASLNDATDVFIEPIRRCDGKTLGNSLVAIERPIRAQI